MAAEHETVVRIAGGHDAAAVARLRALWSPGDDADEAFPERMAAWLEAEGDRRTTWLAWRSGAAVGMASLFEYRRMPKPGRADSRWGYLSNMFVREELRNQGIGSLLLDTIIATADRRGYARLVLSPSRPAIAFYRRAGFIAPDDGAGDDRLLVRPRPVV